MRYLLDTHIFLWYVEQNSELNSNVKDELDNYSNQIYLSIESLREIAIKACEGKIKLRIPFEKIIDDIKAYEYLKLLDIKPEHILTLYNLTVSENYRDPFDHIIISQAISERLVLISADGKFPFYRKQGLILLENN
jgi:PIN domain nuclease of toxin-antitoxin system